MPGLDAGDAFAGAEEHAHIASELDPTLAEPYGALGTAYIFRRRYEEAMDASVRAKQIDPDDTTSALWRATSLVTMGYRGEGNAVLDHLLAIDPKLPTALLWRGANYAYAGDTIDAERLLKAAAEQKLAFAGLGLSLVSAARHETDEAIRQLSSAFNALDTSLPPNASGVLAAGILGDAEARARGLDFVHRYLDARPAVVSGVVVYSMIRMGDHARALAVVQDALTSNDAVFMSLMWSPHGSDVRKLPEFPAFARRIGLAGVWDKYGAPDDCRREASGAYVCE
jgi:tetratricopeptide (TPR) repeat protein